MFVDVLGLFAPPPGSTVGGIPGLEPIYLKQWSAHGLEPAVETDLTPPFSKLPCFELVDTILILKLEFGLVQF